MIGLVIPLYLTTFINSIIENIKKTTKNDDVIFCFVNDGKKEIQDYFSNIVLPDNIYLIHRSTNGGFAKANNSGWEYLLKMYPDIEYLGSINDDTIPHYRWLTEMIKSIEKDDNIGVVVPNIREFVDGLEKDSYATFEFQNNLENPMRIVNTRVYEDTYTKAMSGCCFIARTKCLKEVDFFDGRYMNGCEDVDLSLKMLECGYKIVTSAESTITHLGGSSRLTKPTISDDVQYSMELLSLVWGSNYSYYNKF